VILWRISNYTDLFGMGGLKTSARWHSKGHRVVYLSSSPASALLEILVHFEIEEDHLPRSYRLLEIPVPDDIKIEKLEDWETLPRSWRKKQTATQALGDKWLEQNSAALLEVPSALVPHTSNYLFNPFHEDGGKIKVASISKEKFDRRFFQ
jgi:RES domain-containing protein